MEHLHFLFAAYTAVWAMIFLYIWVMAKRTRRLEEQLRELLRLLEQHNPRHVPPTPGESGQADKKIESA